VKRSFLFSICVLSPVLFVSGSAIADHTSSQLKSYIQKNKSCFFAVAFVKPGETSSDPIVGDELYCISDSVFGEGTINEESGCGILTLNVNNGQTRPAAFSAFTNPRGLGPTVVKDSACKDGGFEKLLETHFNWMGQNRGPLVKETLLKGPIGGKTLVVYSQSDSAQSAYQNAISKMEADAKAAAVEAEKKKELTAATQKVQIAQKQKENTERLSHIEGKWVKACRKSQEKLWIKETQEFKANTFTKTNDYYADQNCSNILVTMNSTGIYKVGPNTSNDKPREIDLTPKKIAYTQRSDEAAADATRQSLYGIMSWKKGVTRDVSSAEAFKGKMGQTQFGIFKLSGTTMYRQKGDQVTDVNARQSLNLDIDSPWKRLETKKGNDEND